MLKGWRSSGASGSSTTSDCFTYPKQSNEPFRCDPFPEAEIATETAASINEVKGAPRRGHRIGNGLTRERAQELLSLPDRESLKGKRDYAILALLLGCGLRRTELLSEVKVGAIARRENRWVLVDITGKGYRVRSVAVPAWVKAAIDAWTIAAGITEGKIFRAVHKGGKVWGQDLTPGAVQQIVQQYARAMGRKAGAA
jgi:site-specific recombinase XerC